MLYSPITDPLDLKYIPMFDKPIGDVVVLKNLSPVFEGLVGGQDDRTGSGTPYEYAWTGPIASGTYFGVVESHQSGAVTHSRLKISVVR